MRLIAGASWSRSRASAMPAMHFGSRALGDRCDRRLGRGAYDKRLCRPHVCDVVFVGESLCTLARCTRALTLACAFQTFGQ